nr:hypothetical protein [Caldimonas sp.]
MTMVTLSSSLVRRGIGVVLACSLPFAVVAAPSSGAAASQPQGPRIGSDIATQCKQMTGDERTACEKDIHAAAKKRRQHGSHATTHAPAASSAG